MVALYRAFMDIIMQRRGPQDLPASGFLLGLVLAGYAVIGVLSLSVYVESAWRLFEELAVNLAIFLGFYTVLLIARGFRARLTQTLTALVGTDVVLSAFALPLHWLAEMLGKEHPAGVVPVIGVYLILLWSFAVVGHILRHAIEIPYLGGILLAVAQFVLTVMITVQLIPQTP